MALFKVLRGNEEHLPQPDNNKDGYAYFTSDTHNFYINHKHTENGPVEQDLVGVGKNTIEGGEVFNDYENNKALNSHSTTFGKNNVAGTKGFTIVSWDASSKTYTLDSVEGLTVGDRISLEWVESYSDCNAITAIDLATNTITVDEFIIGSSTDDSVEKELFIHNKPWLGTHSYGYGAYTEGADNIALLTCAHTEGRGNKSLGFYSHTEGRNNVANYSAHAEGKDNFALGDISHAEGRYTKALGFHSHAEGKGNLDDYVIAQGDASHAEGRSTQAIGNASHSEGSFTVASNNDAHAEGHNTQANGNSAHAEGANTQANGHQAHAEGYRTYASDYSHAEGQDSYANGLTSHAEGFLCQANGNYSHAEGIEARTLSEASHAEGNTNVAGCLGYYYSSFDVTNNTFTISNIKGVATETISTGWNVGDVVSIVNDAKYYAFGRIEKIEGNVITVSNMPEWLPENTINGQPYPVDFSNPNFNGFDDFTIWVHDKPECGVIDIGMNAHVEGISNKAISYNAHAEGRQNISYGQYSHTEGRKNQAGHGGHAEGFQTHAKGMWSHAEGEETTSVGKDSHAEGCRTQANGVGAHSEGNNVTATGFGAHAEGNNAHATGVGAHAEGQGTQANGDQSHAEGYNSKSESYSHAQGINTYAYSGGNHAEGVGTVAKGYGQHAQGRYNDIDEEGKYAHLVGNGWAGPEGTEYRNNIHTLDWNGNAWFAGEVTTGVDKERLVTANEMYDNVNMHYIGECTQDEVFQFSKKGTVALLTEDFSYSYTFTKKILSYSELGLVATVDNSDNLIDDTFINQYAIVVSSISDEIAQSCTIKRIYYNSNNEVDIQFSEEIRDIDFDIDSIRFFVDISAYKDDYIVYDGHKIKILIPGPTHRNIENGDAGQYSLQQKKDVETWTSSNQYILAAMEQGLTNADQGLPINRHGKNIKVGAFNKYASMWGGKSQAIGSRAHAEGGKNIAFESAAHAEGTETFAAGKHSHSEGLVTSALANSSHAEGHLTVAKGITSHAEGYGTIAHAQYSHTEGWNSEAEGDTSHAEGYLTKAEGNYSHSEGYVTSALGSESHAEGKNTFTLSEATHSEGYNNKAGTNCFTITAWNYGNKTYTLDSVEGLTVGDRISIEWGASYSDCATITQIDSTNNTITVDNFISNSNQSPSVEKLLFTHLKPWLGTHAYGYGSHSEGADNVALLTCSHAEGRGNYSLGFYSHTEGRSNTANYCSHAEGRNNFATGDASHAEGRYTKALGNHSHAEGNGDETNYVIAQGDASHAEGKSTNAIGKYSHAEGIEAKALKEASHAEGFHSEASGNYSHAEGYFTDATSSQAHAEGYGTIASGSSAHAEGNSTEAFGEASHAEGKSAKSLANYSHAEGSHTTAMGDSSHTEGNNTVATEYAQHVQGRYNYLDENGEAGNYAHIVGGGTSNTDRKNLHTLDWGGNAWFAGGVTYKYPYANEFTQSQENLNSCRTPIYLGRLMGRIEFDDIFDKGYDESIIINIDNKETYLYTIFNPFEHYIICTLTDEMITTHYEAIASAGIAILSNGTIYIHDITDLKLAGLSELEFNIEIYYTGPSKLS